MFAITSPSTMLLGICAPPVHQILAIMCVHSEHAQQMERQHEAHISDSQAGLRKDIIQVCPQYILARPLSMNKRFR